MAGMTRVEKLFLWAVITAIVLLGAYLNSAHARDRIDPAYRGGDVTICRGLLTSSGTCIGSESNVAPPSYECDPCIYREHRDYGHHDDGFGEHRRRHHREDDED